MNQNQKKAGASLLVLLLAALIALSGCTKNSESQEQSHAGSGVSSVSETVSSAHTSEEKVSSLSSVSQEDDLQHSLEEQAKSNSFEGLIVIAKKGQRVASYSNGKLENGEPITADTPMPVGSVSKQFCAAAILQLSEKGKLSLDEPIARYFPEYEPGKKITIRHLLMMRASDVDFSEAIFELTSENNTYEKNTSIVKEDIFSKEVHSEPDTGFFYSNANYFLLADIIEQITGQRYIDYLRENILTPLGMVHTGSIDELGSSPSWLQGIDFKKVNRQPAITKGAGDIISNAEDMNLWLKGLSSGKVISQEDYEEMITDYSNGEGYGYGIRTDFGGGIGHFGEIGSYVAADYLDPEENITIFIVSGTMSTAYLTQFFFSLVRIL